MSEHLLSTRQAEEKIDTLDSEEELSNYLEELAPLIGWVIIYFNSLEEIISQCIREAILRDPYQDERADVFLSEMMFSPKCRALINLYGQFIENCGVVLTINDLTKLETTLLECSKRRNEYAHADWIGLMKENYVKVKSISKKQGLKHKYKKFEMIKVQEDIEFISEARDTLSDFNERIADQLWHLAN